MVDEGHQDSLIQRGIDEALACQDMLQRAPKKPSLLARAIARFSAVVHTMTRRKPAGRPQMPTASSVTR